MAEPPPAALIRSLDEVLDRASNPKRFARWREQVRATGYCARPLRLSGRLGAIDNRTGEVREVYDTATEPDGTLLKACGQRREAVCASCAETYRGDAFQIVACGLRGGKGVPESVASHPTLFVTLTAPSFGAVHSTRSSGGRRRPCMPRRGGGCCLHGRPLSCWKHHDDDETCLGEPLCRGCFDYQRAVLWNALAPELWRRTAIAIRRKLARVCGLTQAELHRRARVSYVKVAEYQRRGAVHFHAVVRLDGAPAPESAEITPPPDDFTAEQLEQALRAAVLSTTVPVPDIEGIRSREPIRWGGQLEVRRLDAREDPGKVAAYIAKYATKSTEAAGGLMHRLDAVDLQSLRVSPHIRAYVETAWRLGGDTRLEHLRLRRWAHALAYRGHCFTKSRRYSTTFRALDQARAAYAVGRRGGEERAFTVETRMEQLAQWSVVGIGYRTQGDAWLAESAAARAREQRRIGREELRSGVTAERCAVAA